MGYCKQVGLPVAEPVTLGQAKTFLRLPSTYTTDDDDITSLLQAAREDGERLSGRCLAQRQFEQALDSFPYFTDTIQSQQAFPPSYYSMPRYSTTLWNYSQMIKIEQAPLVSVDSLVYIDANGLPQTLTAGTDFVVDPQTELARIFPFANQNWPPCFYCPNAVLITFTAGYDPDPTKTLTTSLPSPPPSPPEQQASYTSVIGIKEAFRRAILNLVAFDYQNRGAGDAAVRARIEAVFMNHGVLDFSPTRG